MRYAVNPRFVFSGTFYVNAAGGKQTRESVREHCGMVAGSIHSARSCEDVDWDFPVHPEKIIGKARAKQEARLPRRERTKSNSTRPAKEKGSDGGF
jgi:hypothetical protein